SPAARLGAAPTSATSAREAERSARAGVCGARFRAMLVPEQIAGRSRLDFPRDRERQLSRQTIYDWIDQPQQRELWRPLLRLGQRRKRPESSRLPGGVSIAGRPGVVDQRRRFGDWEGDTIVGRGQRGGLVSLVERKSG